MIINKEYLRLFSKEHNCMLMIPFNVKGIIFAKKKKNASIFPKASLHPLIFKSSNYSPLKPIMS